MRRFPGAIAGADICCRGLIDFLENDGEFFGVAGAAIVLGPTRKFREHRITGEQ
jgi:hypothetical protein